jgi:hypothetical protein
VAKIMVQRMEIVIEWQKSWCRGWKWSVVQQDVANRRIHDPVPKDVEQEIAHVKIHLTIDNMLGTELLLSSRERMTLGVGAIFWFLSHTITRPPRG